MGENIIVKYKRYYGILKCDIDTFSMCHKKGTVFEFIVDERKVVISIAAIINKDAKVHIAYAMVWEWEQFDMIDESKRLYRLIM